MKIKHLSMTLCLTLSLFLLCNSSRAESITISYGDTFSPALPTASGDVNTTATTHTDATTGNFIFGEAGIYKGANSNYLMFAQNKGYLYNTTSLGTINSVIITYSSGVSTTAKYGVYFGSTIQSSYTTTNNTTIAGQSKSDTVYNSTTGNGFFQVSTSNKNCQIVSIKIEYSSGPDTDAPVFSSTYPKLTNIKASSVDLLLKANESCKAYFMAVAAGADAPTTNAIIANDSVSCTANTEKTATISSLTKATAYDIYVIAKDNAGNVQAAATKITNVTTESREISSVSAPSKLYTGESATITWTTDGIAADANVKIELCKSEGNEVIVASTANDGSETITVPKAAYDANYKIRVSLVESSAVYGETAALAIIPNITINELNTNTDANTEKSKYEGQIVRVKGLVTGIKPQSTTMRNFTLQYGTGVFNSAYAFYCEKDNDTDVALGDSVYVEGVITYYGKLLEIGSNNSNSHSKATIINHDNDLPEPVNVSLKDAKSNAYMSKIVKISGVSYYYDSKKKTNNLINGTDTIMTNTNLVSGTLGFKEGRKYDVTGGIGYNNASGKVGYQILPRSLTAGEAVSYTGKDRTYTIDDIYLYSNDTALSVLKINGTDVDSAATAVFVRDFSNCKGIAATAANAKATVSVKVNGTAIAAADLATKALAENDIVTIIVTAEDGTVGTRNIQIQKDLRSFNFTALSTTTFSTGSTIALSWIKDKVDNFDLYFNGVKLNDETLTTQTTFSYTVPNGVYGTGNIEAIDVKDKLAVGSIAVTINDTQAPAALKLAPANAATNVATNVNLTISFDEAVKVAEGAKIKANEAEAKIVVINDTAIKAFFEKLDYATEYTVTLPAGSVTDAAGNTPTLSWKFTTRPQPVPELYFSEYCTGSSNNKYYEIYNPKEEAVDLSNYVVKIGTNGGTWNEKYLVALKGILEPEDVYVVAHNKADSASIKAFADTLTSNTTSFNGDDALGLFKIVNGDTTLIDVFGVYGEDPGTAWDVAGIKNATVKHTLVRKEIVCGSTDWAEQVGTDSLDSQWIVKEIDDFSNIGIHGIGHRANASSFIIAAADNAAVIDMEKHTITIEAVYGTDLTAIKPQLSLSRGATATINGVAYTNGAAFDFSQPAKLVITSEDGITTLEWTITISVAALPSTAAEIRTFGFANVKPLSVNIDTAATSVSALLDYGTDITALTPVFTISAAASVSATTMVYIDSLNAYSYSTPIDFSNPLKIKVNAQDPTVSKEWTISVGVVQPEVLSIYQIQYSTKDTSAYINKFVSTEGVITSITASGTGFEIYIQDSAKAWNGVLIYDETGVAKNAKLGDKVKVIGTVTEYYTITEIKIVAIEVLSSGNSIEPIVMTAEDAKNEAYESVLVTIKNMTCKEGSGNTFTAEDDTDKLQVYNKYKFDGFAMEVDSVYDVTGIMYYYSSSKSYEIIPRSTADIVKIEKEYNGGNGDDDEGGNGNNSAVDETVANVVSIATYDLTIVVENANADIAVFDISGRMVAKRAANSNRIELQLSKAGLYIVKVGTTSQKVVLK